MKIIRTLGVSLLLLLLATACENPTLGIKGGANTAGNVVIKIAGSGGRTILPQAPDFSRFELTLYNADEGSTLIIDDTSGITGAGVAVQLTVGTWTVTLKAYQQLLGKSVLAATGSAEIQVHEKDRVKTVVIELTPLAIDASVEPGVLSYTVTLPPAFDTATLSLQNSEGEAIEGYGALDLTIAENLSGSIPLTPGYYDLSVIVTKDGQSAGLFESAHIYSGLESPADLDLSAVEFADRVYIMGTLGGARLGTVTITSDAAGSSAIATLKLDSSPAVRSANWIIDVPSHYAGSAVYAVQEFNGEKSNIAAIDPLQIYGARNVALRVTPATPPLVNVAPWYAELKATGGEDSLALAADDDTATYWRSERGEENGPVWLELDFGFPINVNAGRLVFYADSGNDTALINGYQVQYWNGVNTWISLASREQYFEGSADGSVAYSDFFTAALPVGGAQKLRWIVPGGLVENAPALIELGLYQTPSRADLSAAIPVAQHNHDNTQVSTDGEDIQRLNKWVTAAVKETYQAVIKAAQAARDDLFSTQQTIDATLATLSAATTTFNNAKQRGTLDDIVVNEFNVQDGYADKFVITWLREPTYIYRLRMSLTGNGGWSQVAQFDEIAGSTEAAMFTYEVTGIGSGQTRYFTMQAYQVDEDGSEAGGKNVASSGAKETMGVPELTLVNNGPSHHTVSLSWTAANRADAYQIVYTIAGDATSPHTKEVALSELTPIEGGYTYSFRPNGYNNPIILGRLITIRVEALNDELYKASGCSKADITTTSNAVTTRLVGPAELNAAATQATQWDNIQLSWSPVEGAAGYYVFRRQFNLNNSAAADAGVITYYVPAGSGALTVTGKNVAAAETNTVKATAAASTRFTLTDTWMNDGEYSGVYSGYTASYKNQQNDLARGNAYRYFIVPVAASTDTVQFNGSNVSYSITSGGDAITYNSATSLEKTGFAVGFGQNVVATKGTYVSGGGDVNNAIQVTWEAPPLLASAGVTPNYRLYCKAYSGSTELDWVSVDLGNVYSFIDDDNRDMVFEYAIGINGSQPNNLGRFIADSRAQLDGKGIPKGFGFIQQMVKLQGVTRNAQSDGNGNFGERATFYKNANPYYNMGIDGYRTEVLNRNVNNGRQWIHLGDITPEGAPTDATQVTFHVNNTALKVLRDYRHYHKVRSFVLNSNGDKVYCPDPAPHISWPLRDGVNTSYSWPNGQETDYVKWGARQISADEFAAITALTIGTQLNWWANYNSGPDRNTGSGSVSVSNNNTFGYQLNMDFTNAKPYFVTLNGRLHGRVTASPRSPEEYGCYGSGTSGLESAGSNQKSTLTFTGPDDVSMYSGTVTILRMKSGSGAGDAYRVFYNGQDNVAPDPKHWKTNFTFNASNKNQFKTTRNFDWSPSGGIAGTSPDRYWYPLSGNQAGWD